MHKRPQDCSAAIPRPFISVVVPTYERNELLCQTIACLLRQDYAAYEFIVVDQSSDHDTQTREYLASIRESIRYFSLPRPNVSAARNFGYEQSRGDIILFFDDDMDIPSDVVRRVAECYQDASIGGITVTVLQDDSPLDPARRPGMTSVTFFGGQCMSFRRKVFETVGGFHEWFAAQPIPAGEDSDFSYRAVQHGFRLVLNTDIVIRHCGNDASGGCERRRLAKTESTSDVDVFSGLVVFWRNRKPGLIGAMRAFWRGYHAYVLNRDLIRRRFRGCFANNARFVRLFLQVLRKPWLNEC